MVTLKVINSCVAAHYASERVEFSRMFSPNITRIINCAVRKPHSRGSLKVF